MKIETKHIVIGASVLIVGVVAWAYWRKKKGEEIKNELLAKLGLGSGKTGTAKDITLGYSATTTGKPIYWTSPTYWVTGRWNKDSSLPIPTMYKLSDTEALKIAQQLNSLSGDNFITIIKTLKNQAAVSHVLSQFTKVNKKKSLLQKIRDLDESKGLALMNYLNNLPLQ